MASTMETGGPVPRASLPEIQNPMRGPFRNSTPSAATSELTV
jgi:hypothetical protein